MNVNRKIIVFYLLSWVLIMGISAYDDTPRCFKNIQENFFRPETVSKGLQLNKVNQSKWRSIVAALQTRGKTVPNLTKQRAKRMDPNPFEKPYNADGVKKVLRQVTWEIYSDTLKEKQVIHNRQITDSFNYLWDYEMSRIDACLQ